MDLSEIVKQVIEQPSQFKTTAVEKPIDLDLDIGNLLAVDSNPINDRKLRTTNRDSYLKDLNRDNVQILLNHIWEAYLTLPTQTILPTERVEDAIVAALPEPTTQIPREKPLPKAKPETKWEAFARLKGIGKRKKEKLVWDETHKEFRPSYGYRRANDETKQWMLEVPDNADPYEDQFAKIKEAKKERVAKNELQRLRNIARNSKGKIPLAASALPPTQKPDRDHLNHALAVAKTSTASVGKFTESLSQEKQIRAPKGKKRKFVSNMVSAASEKERQMNVLKRMNKQPKLDTNKAIKHAREEEIRSRRQENSQKPGAKKLARKQAAILQGKKKLKGAAGKRRGKK